MHVLGYTFHIFMLLILPLLSHLREGWCLESMRWTAQEVDGIGRSAWRHWPFLWPQVIASWTLGSLLWLLISLSSSLINAHLVCDFQDVHISFPETSSQTIQISFLSFVPCLFDLEKHWIKKNVEPLVMCSSFKLWHLAHFFLVGYKNL